MPDKIIYKAGLQDPDDPYSFVMSDPTVDSYGDIVEPSWKLTQFRQNPIALWMHRSSEPIGVWRSVKVVDDKLRGVLELAEKGTSELIDKLRSLVEQRILRAVSVGFRPGKAEPLDEDNPWNGYRLSDNLLLECSLVTVPANPNALNTKSLDRRFVSSEKRRCDSGACYQLRDSGLYIPKSFNSNSKGTVMKISDRIAQKQDAIANLKEKVSDLIARVGDNGTIPDDLQVEIDEVTGDLERAQAELKTLERLEQAQAGSGAQSKGDGEGAKREPVQRIVTRQNRPKGHRAMCAVGAMLKGFATRTNPVAIVEQEAKDEDGLDIVVRAASAPAVTGTTTWAGNLVEQTWADFVELLRDVSVYGQVPGQRLQISGVTNAPIQAGRGALAAGFLAENGAIPVKAGSISTLSLQPHKMGVISAYSREMARRNTVTEIGAVIRDQFLGDTAEAIDTALLGSTARSAGTNPAGLQDTTETGAANVNAVTNAATGAGNATLAEILGDIDALLARVDAIKASRSGAWLMNNKQVRALLTKQDATTGHFVLRDEVAMGTLYGYPIIQSTNVTDGIVVFVGQDSMAFGQDLAPLFEESTEATLHFENASPTQIGTVATPNTVAAPAINLFQQDLVAIKMVTALDWRVIRQAGVQVLTAATGW